MVGKGSLNHNSREFYASNVDPSRSHLNIEFCREDIRDVYHELFDEAQDRFNAKQTRNDRRIEDYYEKICSSKQEKPFHEIVLQIGNKDDTGIHTELAETAKQCLIQYANGFQARNPTLRVFWSHLHMDEATPHVHIDFVPYITGSKRGMDTRVSLKQALAQLGFKGGTRSATEWNQWAQSEKQVLAEIMQEHGIEWEQRSLSATLQRRFYMAEWLRQGGIAAYECGGFQRYNGGAQLLPRAGGARRGGHGLCGDRAGGRGTGLRRRHHGAHRAAGRRRNDGAAAQCGALR